MAPTYRCASNAYLGCEGPGMGMGLDLGPGKPAFREFF